MLYVLDMAEIPTFQAKAEVDGQGEEAYGASLAAAIGANLTLTVGGTAPRAAELDRALAFPKGAGGLDTTRLEIVFDAGRRSPRAAAPCPTRTETTPSGWGGRRS